MKYYIAATVAVLAFSAPLHADDVTNALDKTSQGISSASARTDQGIKNAQSKEQAKVNEWKEKRAASRDKSVAAAKARHQKIDITKARAAADWSQTKGTANQAGADVKSVGQDLKGGFGVLKSTVTQ